MRRRILLLVVGMTTLVVLAFAIPLVILVRNNAASDVSGRVLDEARTVTLYLRGYPPPSPAQIAARIKARTQQTGWPISVTLPSGTVVGSTPHDEDTLPTIVPRPGDGAAPTTSPAGGDGDDRRSPQAQLQPVSGGQLALGVVPSAAGPYFVRVFLPDDQRYAGSGSKLLLLGGGAIGLILLGVLAGEVLTRRIVRPLVQTATTATALSAGDTSARAPTDGPAEIADVGRALNRLADRIDELIAEERETVADLSHRLRTPLTALRLDAEALDSPADAERIGAHVSTLERMLTAVIHLARRPQREGRMPSCDATAVVADRVAFWSALTEEQARVATVALPDRPVPVRAAEEDLAAAVDALLENVVAHTPEGAAFAVRLSGNESGARLEVADDGPGLHVDEPVRGRSDRGSTGLGLDIARRCAQASGGSLSWAAPRPGAR